MSTSAGDNLNQPSSSKPPHRHRLDVGEDDMEDVEHLKQRANLRTQGAPHFIAYELLKSAPGAVLHDICHDLESFFWVLVWVVLRHASHRSLRDCTDVFILGNDAQTAAGKGGLVRDVDEPIEVVDNPPLTQFLQDFKLLVYLAAFKPKMFGPREPLTYDSVVAVLYKALAREDWPVDDKAIPFVPFKLPRTNGVFAGQLDIPIVATGSKKAAAPRSDNASDVRTSTPGRKKRPLEEYEQEIPSPVASSTLVSGTDGLRPKRLKHTHSARDDSCSKLEDDSQPDQA